MLQNYIILDDVISEGQANFIENSVKDLKYDYKENVNNYDVSVYQPGFVHNIFGENKIYSELFGLTTGLAFQFAEKAGLKFSKFMYSRLFLQLPIVVKNDTMPMHRDVTTFDNIVFLYYVNDSEGPTVIYDKVSEYDTECNVIAEVHPRKGRGLFFNGKYFHSGTPPKSTSRFVINVILV